MNIKRLFCNILYTLLLFVAGAVMLGLHWSHWVPLQNYEASRLAAAIDLTWAYIGGIAGIIFMVIAVFESYLVRAAVRTWAQKK